MVRFFCGGAACARRGIRAALVRGAALLSLLSLIAGAARLGAVQTQPAFFSLLFPQLMDWLIAPSDERAQDEPMLGGIVPGEAVAL